MNRHLGVAEITKQARSRLQAYGTRDNMYDLYLAYYFGRQARGKDLPILAMNSAGRPLMRQVGESIGQNRHYSSRRLAPVVDDYAAMLGQQPTITIEIPDPSEQGEEKAELQTKYVISTTEISDMKRQQPNGGFFLSCLGDACYVATPVANELRPAWEVVSPRHCYPSFWQGYRQFQLYDLIVDYVMSPEDIDRQYGVEPRSDSQEDCTVVTYMSQWQRTVFVGFREPRLIADVEWDLGRCPAVWAFNKVTSGQMACSDIAQAMDQQDFADFIANVMADGISYTTYPIIGIKQPFGVGEIITGPGAPPVSLAADSDIIVREVKGDTQTLLQLLQNTTQDMNATTGSSQVRQEGQMKSSIVTGRAVQAVQGPQSTRVELKQQILSSVFQELVEVTFRMQERAPRFKDAKLDLQGRYKGHSFREPFDAAKDIDGWYRSQCSWDELVGMSLQQKVATAYEGQMAEIWDDVHSMKLVGIEDPLEMTKRIEAMKERKARQEQELQQMGAGGPPGPQPNVHVPRSGNVSPKEMQRAEQSSSQQGPQQMQNMQPPSNLIMHPTWMRTGPSGLGPGQVPIGVTMQAVRQALFAIVDRLKGEVYAVGDLAWKPSTQKPELEITDFRDHKMVLQAARKVAPNVKVFVIDRRKSDPLPMGATRVA